MPIESKPLFHPDALRPGLAALKIAPAVVAARGKLAEWAKMLGSGAADKKKETELLPGFIEDVFKDVLGYTRSPADQYTLKREALIQVDGKFADAGLGTFAATGDTFVAVLEGKGPRDPLDRPHAGRKHSAVTQAALYALQLKIDWYLVTNLKETRLYYKRQDTNHYERFDTAKLATDDAEFRRFVFLLGADRMIGPDGANHLDALLTDSRRIGRELTTDYYAEYRDLRQKTFQALVTYNPGRKPRELLAATQKILDRVLFISFCEDRRLLPAESVRKAYEHEDEYAPRPVWENFKALFRWVDAGHPKRKIAAYNGGLFAPDPAVESLTVPDDVCAGFKRLADYEYGSNAEGNRKIIDVEILGHIFEQSISDLEEMQKQLADPNAVAVEPTGPTKRKKEGAFYTPAFITRYIVAETLGPVLRERFEAFRAKFQATATGTAVRLLDNPRVFDREKLNDPQSLALTRFWRSWIGELEAIRVVDPSCGSGAFLIEAFDQLFAVYEEAEGFLSELGGRSLIDVSRSILTNNLFGMDLNGEAVEIARLSCWIKTAEEGKKLTALDANIVQGNSVAAEPSPREAWQARFPDVFTAGGFDVVIGNPPYVRQELIKDDKPFLQKHYKAYDGVADLYVYFYELGLNILRPGGRLGYVVTNKWMKAGYGEPLRKLYGESAWVETVVDLGHNKEVFPDADVFPCLVTVRKPSDSCPPPESVCVCVLPREQTRVHDLSEQVRAEGVAVPRARLGEEPWSLEPPGVAKLMDKLRATGVPLKEFAGVTPLYGVKTGCNEAFIVDASTRDRLIAEHPSSESVIKKYLRGQDVDRWRSVWAGEWMIFARRGIDIDQFPAIKRHLEQFRTQLEPKPKDWTGGEWGGRKPGSYKWYELQDPVDYWREFEKPKLVYQDIAWQPRFCLDVEETYGNNTVYILPSGDRWTLAALNSPVSWWFAWRGAQHGKDEALRFFAEFMENFPIPKPTDTQRAEVESSVGKLIDLAGKQQAGCAAALDWLRIEFGVEKASQKLQAVADLDADTLVAEVKKARGRSKPLSVVDLKRLKDEHTASVLPLKALARETEQLERRVSDIVNAAFGLTPDDVKLMWSTAPPRMPIAPPTGNG